MRGIEISLNQTQKIRLQRALQQLESLYSKANFNASVTVADTIPVSNEDTILKYEIPFFFPCLILCFVKVSNFLVIK